MSASSAAPRPSAPCLVVLAAGESRRLGECKALVDLGGQSALARLLAAGAELGPEPPLVVSGADHAALARALPAGAELVQNERWSEGRTGSVRAARARRPNRDLLIAPVDTPLVSAAVFRALAAEWIRMGAPARGWLAPATPSEHGPRPGHPIVVGRTLLEDLDALAPDTPLRLLRARADPLWVALVEDEAIHDDLDLPSDLARLRARFER